MTTITTPLRPNLLTADWGKQISKREVWQVLLNETVVRRVTDQSGRRLTDILEYARTLQGPTLVGVDAAIGAPRGLIERFRESHAPDAGFFEWLRRLFGEGEPDVNVTSVKDWSPLRPFVALPAGEGTMTAFREAAPLMRAVDERLGASSPLIASGLPGSVGSGTRELWREMVEGGILDRDGVTFWPFDGPLDSLLRPDNVVVAEIYPRLCYGIALGATLPAKGLRIAKGRPEKRVDAIERLTAATWRPPEIEELERCGARDAEGDNFDAMMSAVALFRLFSECASLESRDSTDGIEGGILGEPALVD